MCLTTTKLTLSCQMFAGFKMLHLTSSRPSRNRKMKHSLAKAQCWSTNIDVHVSNSSFFSARAPHVSCMAERLHPSSIICCPHSTQTVAECVLKDRANKTTSEESWVSYWLQGPSSSENWCFGRHQLKNSIVLRTESNRVVPNQINANVTAAKL